MDGIEISKYHTTQLWGRLALWIHTVRHYSLIPLHTHSDATVGPMPWLGRWSKYNGCSVCWPQTLKELDAVSTSARFWFLRCLPMVVLEKISESRKLCLQKHRKKTQKLPQALNSIAPSHALVVMLLCGIMLDAKTNNSKTNYIFPETWVLAWCSFFLCVYCFHI